MARVYGARQNTYGNMITTKSAGWSREEGSGARGTRMVSRSRSGAASLDHISHGAPLNSLLEQIHPHGLKKL